MDIAGKLPPKLFHHASNFLRGAAQSEILRRGMKTKSRLLLQPPLYWGTYRLENWNRLRAPF